MTFRWIDDDQIVSRSVPKFAVVMERREWGNFYGFIKEITQDGNVLCVKAMKNAGISLEADIPVYAGIFDEIRKIEKGEIGGINRQIENYRLKIRGVELEGW